MLAKKRLLNVSDIIIVLFLTESICRIEIACVPASMIYFLFFIYVFIYLFVMAVLQTRQNYFATLSIKLTKVCSAASNAIANVNNMDTK